MGNKKVAEYIELIETQGSSGNDSPIDYNQQILNNLKDLDLKGLATNHKNLMPKITGPKAYAIPAPLIRDEPDVPDNNFVHY